MANGSTSDEAHARGRSRERLGQMMSQHAPVLLTPCEVAELLRTTKKAIYAMIERGLLPGVTRIGRRVLVRSADLLDFLDHNRTPSPQEYRR